MGKKLLFGLMVAVAAAQIGCGPNNNNPDMGFMRDEGMPDDMAVDMGDGGVVDQGDDGGVVDMGPDMPIILEQCGNGTIDVWEDGGVEQCDDGNRQINDGCDNNCQLEPGANCPVGGGACTRCGNSINEDGEDCDDGNLNNNDGCSDACTVEVGSFCPSVGACTICGNRQVNSDSTVNPEQCDDGMTCDDGTPCTLGSTCADASTCQPRAGDGCSVDCQVEDSSWTCPVDGAPCFRCGDGIKQNLERCDTGGYCGGDVSGTPCVLGDSAACGGDPAQCMVVGTDGCSADCTTIPRFWSCSVDSTTGGSVCTLCGDGVAEGSETCDDGAECDDGTACTPGDTCTDGTECRPRANDGCSELCRADNGWSCPPAGGACVLCGDGTVDVGFEECDDGNIQAGDGCNASCRLETGWDCSGDPSFCTRCGDGSIDSRDDPNNPGNPIETCDDRGRCSDDTACSTADPTACGGNPADCTPRAGDGCSDTCQTESVGGWVCVQRAGGTVCSRCGDGALQGDEVCDDGQTFCADGTTPCDITDSGACGGNQAECRPVGGDGCSATCTRETNYICDSSTLPTQCYRCGDGQLDPTETCDDGNNLNGDGCSSACVEETGWTCLRETDGTTHAACTRCGDGVVQRSTSGVGEGCDDRNFTTGDGCDMCQVETDWTCATTTQGGQEIHAGCANCGNGDVEIGETCDDGVEPPANDDGCSDACQVESGNGWTCNSAEPSVCQNCGNGTVEGNEQCDDGGNAPDDGCSATCTTEPNWTCVGGTCYECGDGQVDTAAGETCDDGGVLGGDGCSATCRQEAGWTCLTEADGTTHAACTRCGDGVVQASTSGVGESCDDRNTITGDGCNACQVENGWTCSTVDQGGVTVHGTCQNCGDGTLQGTEECDDGNGDADDGCTACAVDSGGWTCDSAEPSVCQNCGNGTIEGTEVCDTTTGCTASCTADTNYTCVTGTNTCYLCGDGHVDTESGETCDDGNTTGGDGCSRLCREEAGWTCVEDGSNDHLVCSRCGDRVVQANGGAGETCDDGNTIAGDGCNACQVETGAGWVCYTRTSGGVELHDGCANCGNGAIETREDCDDGNGTDSDGCTACAVDGGGWTCAGAPSVCQLCGNGTIEGTETCDDGDTSGSDGCSAACAPETFWNCTGEPSVCTRCGDGMIQGTEQCDDGNNSSNDGCTRLCMTEAGWDCDAAEPTFCTFCGDGRVEGSEECDDRNQTDNDGCTSCVEDPGYQCHIVGVACAQCGNGMLELGEQCDDGMMFGGATPPADGDGCSARCQLETGPYDCRTVGSPCTECGDGTVEGFETCDDGNLDNDDGCSSVCQTEPGSVCDPATGICTAAQCGDGITAGDEECDNGVDPATGLPQSGDGCSVICRLEPGYDCGPDGDTCVLTQCGNGVLEAGEACDDSNNTDSDGCAGDCSSVDPGFGCPIEGELCTMAACGNGLLDSGEQCDTAWDPMSSATGGSACIGCKIQLGYYCEADASPEGGTCFTEMCGNGFVRGAEVCDDGNTSGGDGCEADCLSVTPLYNCRTDADTDAGSCQPIVEFVEVLSWNVSNVSPNAMYFDPTLRAFVGYKSTGAKPIELCLDGTILQDFAPENDRPSYSTNNGSTLSGATYNPYYNTVIYVNDTNSPTIRVVPLADTQDGAPLIDDTDVVVRDESGTILPDATSVAVTDSGDLVITTTTNTAYVYYYDGGTNTSTGFGEPVGGALDADYSFQYRSSGVGSNIGFSIPGADLYGTAYCSSGGSCGAQLFHFYDSSSPQTDSYVPEFASSDTPGLLFPGAADMLAEELDGSEAGLDGGSFVVCDANGNVPCRLYARSCETDADCAAVVPGTQCITEDEMGNPVPSPYCFAPVNARDDVYAVATTSPDPNQLDVLLNDVRSAGICTDNTVQITNVTAIDGAADLQARLDILTSGGQLVDYTKPTGECGITETFEYTALLGGGESDTATVRVFIECVCGDGEVNGNEQCDDGNGNNTDRCANDCTVNVACGDGFLDDFAGEECDPPDPGNGCTANCRLESICGDGNLEGVEACDDGAECNDGTSCTTPGSICGSDGSTCAPRSGDGCTALCVVEFCGDGVTNNSTEQCDDGNTTSGDGCESDCMLPAVCGNGIPEGSEECDFGAQCDDGATCVINAMSCGDGSTCAPRAGNGCTENCEDEFCGDGIQQSALGEECEPPNVGQCDANCQLAFCGDGEVNGDEECDDGQNGNGDGCTDGCIIEFCGDGTDNNGSAEECDDGNTNDLDACNNSCQANVCGDSVVNNGEACDDGNATAEDGCNNCVLEECGDSIVQGGLGEACDPPGSATGPGNVATCTFDCQVGNYCGDGAIGGTEQCDDGNNTDGDGCTAGCVAEFCGDGVDNNGTAEQCDDGNTNDTDACNNSCQTNVCGDDIVNNGEECDDGSLNGTAGNPCDANCEIHVCGDGVVDDGTSTPNLGEECDPPGSTVSVGGTTATCTFDCQIGNYCGDGTVGGSEQCDDGNSTAGDGCGPTCQDEVCGNNVMDPGEACDDGNTNDGDGCSSLCEIEDPCGNGAIDGSEECDDGNNMNGDGCSATCTDEWVCGDGDVDPGETCDPADSATNPNPTTGATCNSNCQYDPICGDGNVDNGEDCDAGAANGTSGEPCTAGCVLRSCGDGNVDADLGETCEPPNVGNCDATCQQLIFCGNGEIEPTNQTAGQGTPGDTSDDLYEVCDDGNTQNEDGCNSQCQPESCGDGIVQLGLGEECDPADPVTMEFCDENCNVTQECGNGLLEGTEECDEGGAVNGTSGQPCQGDCTLRVCGDGTTDNDLGEECDLGDGRPGDMTPGTNCDTSGCTCSTICELIIG